MFNDTIAAISTAVSASGIGIIRVSGAQAMEIADRVYRSKIKDKKLTDVPTHTIHYGHICDGEEIIDEVLVMVMRAPRTFTGEDTVEIDCHGGIYAMKKVLDTVLKQGARIADPGEFTKRAFFNGRLDLSQAEAVMDVIQSQKFYPTAQGFCEKQDREDPEEDHKGACADRICPRRSGAYEFGGVRRTAERCGGRTAPGDTQAVIHSGAWKDHPGRCTNSHLRETKCGKVFLIKYAGR